MHKVINLFPVYQERYSMWYFFILGKFRQGRAVIQKTDRRFQLAKQLPSVHSEVTAIRGAAWPQQKRALGVHCLSPPHEGTDRL